MRVYHDRDADLARLLDRKIAVVGYGSQGHAHALNLRDSGVKGIRVALPAGSASAARARGEALTVTSVAKAAAWADMIVMAAPDELQRAIFENDIAPHLRDGAALLFIHGFNIHFK
ncbi:MAG: NAD(P)-binding domain-containing protein, partial [Caulobacteraceae bacterium]|nr:NAD(P)-binding domain-containing protein [Caulobacteraceae bacterium]